ncbi:MAG: hypothetical protein AB7D39_20975 [Pseudodesulfovibrio sp.]|uniref:hypothetical protein n=1 Tax=Pseudodesulfovibrio sp. TaxID=2035812 RepID=UPI003D0D9401
MKGFLAILFAIGLYCYLASLVVGPAEDLSTLGWVINITLGFAFMMAALFLIGTASSSR